MGAKVVDGIPTNGYLAARRRTLMKDARTGLHSFVKERGCLRSSVGSGKEFEHSCAQVQTMTHQRGTSHGGR